MAQRKNRFLNDLHPVLEKHFSAELANQIWEKSWQRFEELVMENPNESKKIRIHTVKRIYPGIASFDALVQCGVSREEATKFLKDYYLERSKKAGDWMRTILKIPGLYRWMPRFFAKITPSLFGEESGFKFRYYENSASIFKFDMLVCPYQEICTKYGCPEIVAMYCEADDMAYGNMHPKILWLRSKTLGKQGDCCDFDIRIAKKS